MDFQYSLQSWFGVGSFLLLLSTPNLAFCEENFVVLEFQTKGIEYTKQAQASNAVRGVALQMLSKEEVLVWTPESMQSLLEQKNTQLSELSDASEIKIGKAIGADFLFTGTITNQEQQVLLSFQLFDVASSKLLANATRTITDSEDLILEVQRLSSTILAKGMKPPLLVNDSTLDVQYQLGTGSFQDRLAELQRQKEELAEQQEEIERAEEENFEEIKSRLLNKATKDWNILKTHIQNKDIDAEEGIRAFLQEYEDATIDIDGEQYYIEIPEVVDAKKTKEERNPLNAFRFQILNWEDAGTKEWDKKLQTGLLTHFDKNSSNVLEQEEIQAIPCDIWSTVHTAYMEEHPFTNGFLIVYGFSSKYKKVPYTGHQLGIKSKYKSVFSEAFSSCTE